MRTEYDLTKLASRRNPYSRTLEKAGLVKRGTGTSKVEILNVSPHGVWLLVRGKEYFLPYQGFPWFKDARLYEIENVRLVHGHNLRWEDLDVDLALESLDHPDLYPLKYR